jgi:DNA-binding MarR family transcriptional regulator
MRNENYQLSEELIGQLFRFTKSLKTVPKGGFPDGLRHSEVIMLFRVARCCGSEDAAGEGVLFNTLCERSQLSKSNASQMIRVLEAKDYVRRDFDPRDRRVVIVHLTAKGQRCIQDVQLPALESLDRAARQIGEDRARQLLGLLEELNDALAAVSSEERMTS